MGYQELEQASAAIAELSGRARHDAALVLGSGLGDYASELPDAIPIPYGSIPNFPVPRVEGHAGTVYSVAVDERAVLIFAGRVHFYEGWDLSDVVFGVRTAALSGCHTVLLTNATGGVNRDFSVGDLVVVRDHINLTGSNPLIGTNDPRLGPRFPDISDAYTSELRHLIEGACRELDMPYKEGVYAWFTGPSYESPAEIEMARRMGADLVGMSTVPEVIALAHMGSRVAAISVVTNMAAGTSDEPVTHAAVQEAAALAKAEFSRLIEALLPRLVVAAS